MRRDLDLVRDILVLVERADRPVDAIALDVPGHTTSEVAYHVRLLAGAGLVDVLADKRDANGSSVLLVVGGLTWDGCDYLDALRDPGIWAKAKRAISAATTSATFGTVKAVCVEVATRAALAEVAKIT